MTVKRFKVRYDSFLKACIIKEYSDGGLVGFSDYEKLLNENNHLLSEVKKIISDVKKESAIRKENSYPEIRDSATGIDDVVEILEEFLNKES